jgi:hypothetical protein
MHLTGMTSGQIVELLRQRHAKDVFVDECKNGPTWIADDLLILDAWAMPRSYSPLRTIGYEIKVDRADFEQDQKWVRYMECCHLFFFVCPAGLIRATDIPAGVGLIWVSSTGKLHVKQPSDPNHKPDPAALNKLLTYVVMSRSRICHDNRGIEKTEPTHMDLLQERLKAAEEGKWLCDMVQGHIRKRWEDIGHREAAVKRARNDIENFERRLLRLGIVWDSTKEEWVQKSDVLMAIQRLGTEFDAYRLRDIEIAGKHMIEAVQAIREILEPRKELPIQKEEGVSNG